MGNPIEIFDTIEELSQYFAVLLAQRIRETPSVRDFSWVLSGGSTPRSVFSKVASSCRDTIDWNRVKVFWGDERCVDPDDRESNFKMARENFLDHVPIPSSNIFRIHGEANPAVEADRYSDLFGSHVNMYQGVPQADLIMLGLGEDGHTASIFPSNIELFSSDKLFDVAEHPETRQKRITATGKVINHAKLVVILATGETKSVMVARIINRLSGYNRLPAAHVSPENGEFLWLLDHKSASNLTSG